MEKLKEASGGYHYYGSIVSITSIRKMSTISENHKKKTQFMTMSSLSNVQYDNRQALRELSRVVISLGDTSELSQLIESICKRISPSSSHNSVNKKLFFIRKISSVITMLIFSTIIIYSSAETLSPVNNIVMGHQTFIHPSSVHHNNNHRRVAPPNNSDYINKDCPDCSTTNSLNEQQKSRVNISPFINYSSPLRTLIDDNLKQQHYHRRYKQQAIPSLMNNPYYSKPTYEAEPEPDTILIVGQPIIPSAPITSERKIFKPNQNQDCPRTGRTVCDQIHSYPSDEIYRAVTAAKKSFASIAVGFTLDSLFSDERENDPEPVLRHARRTSDHANNKLGTGVVVYETKVKYLVEDQAHPKIKSDRQHYSPIDYQRKLNSSYDEDEQQDYSRDDETYSTTKEEKPIGYGNDSPDSRRLLSIRRHREDTILAEMDNYKNFRTKRSENSGNIKEGDEIRSAHRRSDARQGSSVRLSKRQASGELLNDPESIDLPKSIQISPLCLVKSMYITPRAALNDKREWKYIVNTPEKDPQVRQIIRVDICLDPLGPCSDQISLPFGFSSQCKQRYLKKKLLAVNGDNGRLEVDTFFIPSCCVCQLIRDPEFSNDTGERRSK